MVISTYLYLRRAYLRKVRRDFDKHNRVLRQADIERILEGGDTRTALRVFRSAVVDHQKVDGIPYHTKYPSNAHIGHDRFRKAFIADGIGGYGDALEETDLSDAVLILDKLTDVETEPEHTQILAWNSLGRLARSHPGVIEHEKKRAREAFAYSTASSLGALLFLDHLLGASEREVARELIEDGIRLASHSVPRALLCYYANKTPGLDNPSEQDPDTPYNVRKFILAVQGGCVFDQGDFNEGLRLIGFKPPFWEGTPEAEVVKRVAQRCGDLIPAIGAFYRGSCEKQKRHDSLGCWTVPIE